MMETVLNAMKSCVLCRGMGDEEVRAFCEHGMAAGTLRLRSINKDEYIFHEGASPRAMYIPVSYTHLAGRAYGICCIIANYVIHDSVTW